MPKSAEVERWFKRTKPPSEAALRRVRDIILSADPSMRERIQYGITFSSTRSGDFAAFVRYSEPGVNLRLMRGGRLRGRYPHLEGATVKRMRIATEKQVSARASELRAIVKEWCALGDAAKAPKAAAHEPHQLSKRINDVLEAAGEARDPLVRDAGDAILRRTAWDE